MGGWIFLEVPLIIFYNKTTKSVKRLSDNLLPEKAMRPISKQSELIRRASVNSFFHDSMQPDKIFFLL